jgi:hypothetical protein
MIKRTFHFAFASALASVSTLAAAVELSDLPKEIAAPGAHQIASFEAIGAQIYTCSKNAKGTLEWTFREPIASLMQDGKTAGRHFAGPTWEFADSTHVAGKAAGKAPGKTAKDIPWLKLAIAEPASSGPAGGATTVLRINTRGGAFDGICTQEGELRAEPYAATYVFVK